MIIIYNVEQRSNRSGIPAETAEVKYVTPTTPLFSKYRNFIILV